MSLVGVVSLTYFCGVSAIGDVTRIVSDALGVTLEDDWSRVSVTVDGGGVTVNRRIFAPNSDFSRTIMGLQNALRRARPLDPERVPLAVATIDACDVMLGVVFDPPLEDGDARQELVRSWAAQLKAIVFDGEFVVSPQLHPIAQLMPGR